MGGYYDGRENAAIIHDEATGDATYLDYVGNYAVMTDQNLYYAAKPHLLMLSELMGHQCNIYTTMVIEIGDVTLEQAARDGLANITTGGPDFTDQVRYVVGYKEPELIANGHKMIVDELTFGTLELRTDISKEEVFALETE